MLPRIYSTLVAKVNEQMDDFVICVNNDGNPASLIAGKLYRVLPDTAVPGMIRIIDEDASEIDGYLYPAAAFAPVALPEAAIQALFPTPNCQSFDSAQDNASTFDP
jgi:hypothetical protein